MTDDNLDTYSPTDHEPKRTAIARAARKLGFTILALAVAWIVFAQIAPRLMLSQSETPTSTASPPSIPTMAAPDVEQLKTRIEKLEAEVQELKSRPAVSTESNDASLARLQQTIRTLQDRPTGKLEARIISQQNAIDSLQGQINKLQRESGGRLATMTAYNQLRDAVARGDPFTYEMKRLRNTMHDRSDIQTILNPISALASTGVPTQDTLEYFFEQSAPRALAPDIRPDSFWGNLRSLIRIRKVGTPEGNDDEAIIARAEAALTEGRIEATIKTLAGLSPSATTAFASWKEKAQQHVLSREVLQSLEIALMKKKAFRQHAPVKSSTSEDDALPLAPPPPPPPPGDAVEQPHD